MQNLSNKDVKVRDRLEDLAEEWIIIIIIIITIKWVNSFLDFWQDFMVVDADHWRAFVVPTLQVRK